MPATPNTLAYFRAAEPFAGLTGKSSPSLLNHFRAAEPFAGVSTSAGSQTAAASALFGAGLLSTASASGGASSSASALSAAIALSTASASAEASAPTSALSASGILPAATPPSTGALRDRDIRRDLRDRLEATLAFDAVFLSEPPEGFGRGASLLKLCTIEPNRGSTTDEWDDAPDGGIEVDGWATITVYVRDDDPQARDEAAEQLLDLAMNCCNGESLAGLTLPTFTKCDQWTWQKATPPERKIQSELVYKYIVEGSDELGTDE